MKEIIKKFSVKVSLDDINQHFYMYGGNIINDELFLSDIITNEDKKRNLMMILVNSNINPQNENSSIAKSKIVICPKCNECINLKIKNYKISLYGCKKNHNIDDILFKDFLETQNVDLKKIICDNCKEKNKNDSFNHEFYKCVTCNKNLCVLCKSVHEKDHKIFDYDKRYSLCKFHSEFYYSYCKECNLNLCINCEKKHLNHQLIYFGTILPDIDDAKNKLKDFRNQLNKFKKSINDIIERLDLVKDNMEKYYELFNHTIENMENKDRNYEIINNINEIQNTDVFNDLNNINRENNFKNKINFIFDISDKIGILNKDEITLIYMIGTNDNSIKIFDSEFVNNNKNNCKILYENKEYELMEIFQIDNIKNKEKLIIKLKGIKKITNANKMFYECFHLYSVPDINNWDISQLSEMNEMFKGCEQCINIPKKFIINKI